MADLCQDIISCNQGKQGGWLQLRVKESPMAHRMVLKMAYTVNAAVENKKHHCVVISNHILVCMWLYCFLNMTSFGVVFPSVWTLQDKQLGDAILVSSIVKSQRGNMFAFALCWWILIGWKQSTSICTLVVTCSRQNGQVTFEMNVSRQGRKANTKDLTKRRPPLSLRSFSWCSLGLPKLYLPIFYVLYRPWLRECPVYG